MKRVLLILLTLTACTDSGEMERMKEPTRADTIAQCHKEFEAISMRALPTWSMCNRQYYAKQNLNISYRMGEISYAKYKREWLRHDSLHKVYSDSFDFVDRRMDSLYAIMYPVDTNKLK